MSERAISNSPPTIMAKMIMLSETWNRPKFVPKLKVKKLNHKQAIEWSKLLFKMKLAFITLKQKFVFGLSDKKYSNFVDNDYQEQISYLD